jgi:poly(3-hydroxyalkanoate) synthetase
MEADKVRILNKYLPGQMMAQTFTLMAQGKLFEAQAITEGVESQLKGEELNLFRRTVNSVATALNVQNWFNVGYYGGPQAYYQGQQQRSQEWTARDLGNKTNRINLDFLNDTYKWRVNTVKWQNKNEKMNFVRNVFGGVGDLVKIGTMIAPGSRLGNVFFKPSAPAPAPAPQGSISFF